MSTTRNILSLTMLALAACESAAQYDAQQPNYPYWRTQPPAMSGRGQYARARSVGNYYDSLADWYRLQQKEARLASALVARERRRLLEEARFERMEEARERLLRRAIRREAAAAARVEDLLGKLLEREDPWPDPLMEEPVRDLVNELTILLEDGSVSGAEHLRISQICRQLRVAIKTREIAKTHLGRLRANRALEAAESIAMLLRRQTYAAAQAT